MILEEFMSLTGIKYDHYVQDYIMSYYNKYRKRVIIRTKLTEIGVTFNSDETY